MADRVVVLFDGVIQQLGTPAEVFERPANRFVAGFIGTPRMNCLDVTVGQGEELIVEGSSIDVGGSLPKAAGEPVVLGIRPEAVAVDPDGPLEVSVTLTENLGSETLAYGLMGTQEFLLLVPTRAAPQAGQTVRVACDPADMHVFEPGALGERLTLDA